MDNVLEQVGLYFNRIYSQHMAKSRTHLVLKWYVLKMLGTGLPSFCLVFFKECKQTLLSFCFTVPWLF